MHLLRHFFTPRHSNNQRAKLLHFHIILCIAFLLFAATYILSAVKNVRPDILGTTINISIQELLIHTNAQRQQQGLSPLTYNNQLANAASAKGKNMLQYNYWAHINPTTGVTPWTFIQKSGYQYTFAGENLARGFTNANDAVNAWMASPSHRANMLSPNYQEVGFAIVDGTLTGEKNTILIVEMFGGKSSAPLKPQQKGTTAQVPAKVLPAQAAAQQQYDTVITTPVIDRFIFAKNVTQVLLILFIAIFILDIILIEKKQITRLVGHNLDHILFLLGAFLFIIFMRGGTIQ